MSRLLCIALTGLAATGCGLGAGDYATYQIAQTTAEESGDCGDDDDVVTDIRSGGQATLFFTGGDDGARPFLDLNGSTFEGEETDDGYVFTGTSSIETEISNDATLRTEGTTRISVRLDGETIEGTVEVSIDQSCQGEDCQGITSTQCELKSSFIGVEVEGSVGVTNASD